MTRRRLASLLAALATAVAAAATAQAQPPRPAAAGQVRLLQPRFIPPASGGARAHAARAGKHPRGVPRALSPRLAQLAKPSVRSATARRRARALALPVSGPGSLVRSRGRVVVQIRAASARTGQLRALRRAGASIRGVDAHLGLITAAVAPRRLAAVARVAGVRSVTPALAPLTAGAATSHARARASGVASCHGAVTSEADQQLQAATARSTFGVDGSGQKVGIISDSFDTNASAVTNAATDVASGDLPGPGNPCGRTTPVDVRADASGEDEGRAMAQVVHDLAPGADLAFTPATDENAFVNGIDDLAASGASVIVDDITFLDEPFFQDGPPAVEAARAANAGIPYYSSAGNNNLIVGGRDRASYEAPSYRATSCPASVLAIAAEADCMNFAPSGGSPQNAQPFLVAPGGSLTLDFQWAEPWFGVNTDLDIFLLDGVGNVISDLNGASDSLGGIPFELVGVTNGASTAQIAQVVIGRFAGAGTPRLKWNLLQPEGNVADVPAVAAGDTVGPAIFGHNGGSGVMSVAAVPFNDSSQVESYSSRGPVTHYFGPVTSTTPAAPLASPDALAKPDIAATDGAATTFFAQNVSGVWRFFGTSEAAPHAAAIAALEMQAAPNASVARVEAAQTFTALPVGGFGATAEGAGLVDAFDAVRVVRQAPAVATGPASSITTSSATVRGAANPNGGATTGHFEYGPTTAYGSSTPPVSLGAGAAPLQVTFTLGSLAPATTYHYRFVASNPAGTTFGPDATFTTAPVSPGGGTPGGGTPGGGTPGGSGGTPPPAPKVTAVTLKGKKLTLKISGSVKKVSITIKKGGKVVARLQGGVRNGKFSAKLKQALRKGSYKLTIVLTPKQGKKTTIKKTLKV